MRNISEVPHDYLRPKDWNPRDVRVGIVGMGLRSPLGLSVEESWRNFLNGVNGVSRIDENPDVAEIFEPYKGVVKTPLAAMVNGFDASKELDGIVAPKDQEDCSRLQLMTAAAMHEAFNNVRLSTGEKPPILSQQEELIGKGPRTRLVWKINPDFIDPRDVAVIGGTGIGGAPAAIVAAQKRLDAKQLNDPREVFRALFGGQATRLSLIFGARGKIVALSAECATGNAVQSYAMDLIRLGRAKMVMVAAGESSIQPVGISLFEALRALEQQGLPDLAPLAFNNKGRGFVFGESAAAAILMDMDFAHQKGIAVEAEVAGYGSSGDAFHKCFPHDEGRGAKETMRQEILDGGLPKEGEGQWAISYHATGTDGDKIEARATTAIFDEFPEYGDQYAGGGSFKESNGHGLGGATLMEGIYCVQALKTGIFPAQTKSKPEDIYPEAKRLKLVLGEPRKIDDLDAVMNNGFGFGGTNEGIIYRRVK